MEITVDNSSYKNRNKGKIKTLVGSDEVYMNILDMSFLLDGKPKSMKTILEDIYNIRDTMNAKLEKLNTSITTLETASTDLKSALKKYIYTENQVDKATTSSIEILSSELNKINQNLKELNTKCKYL